MSATAADLPFRWLPTTRGHGHSPLNITCPICHKQQSSKIGLVPLLFATHLSILGNQLCQLDLSRCCLRQFDYTRDLAVVNWTCPVVVSDISCGQWDLSRCCLQPIGFVPLLFVTFRLY